MKTNIDKLIMPILTLTGVIIGGLVAGFFSIRTQKNFIDAQNEKTAIEYSISRNEKLITYVDEFIDETTNFLSLLNSKETKNEDLDEEFFKLSGTSLKILAISDFNIGKESLMLVASLSLMKEKKKLNTYELESISEFVKALVKWTIAVKVEMKIIDYNVDEKELEKDLYRFFIGNILSTEPREE